MDVIFSQSTALIPILFILSTGSDPTREITQLAHQKKRQICVVAMGQDQENLVSQTLQHAMLQGHWMLLQNGHLCLSFMNGIKDLLDQDRETCCPNFRLFLTTDH